MPENWRTLGDVSHATWTRVITDAGGPAELASVTSWREALPHSALVLAQAGIECAWGTTENLNKLANKNALNLKMPLNPDGTREPGFMTFGWWAAGIAAAVDRITSTTYGGGVYAQTVTVADLVNVFAPRSENDTAAYVDFVESHVAAWGIVETVPPNPTPGDPIMPGSVIGVPVTQIMLPASASNRPGTKLPSTGPLFIVVHETGNSNVGADAVSQIRYLQSAEARQRQTSYHLSVDDHAIIQGMPLDEIAWHAGDGCDDPSVDIGCFRSIAIEGCINRDGDERQMRRTYAESIARICAGDPAFDWGGGSTRGRFDINRLRQHIQVSTPGPNQHHCPDHMLNEGFWPTFMTWVDEAWAVWGMSQPQPQPQPTPIYAKPDRSWMGDDLTKGSPSDHSPMLTVGGEQIKVKIWGAEREYETLKVTPRYQGPDTKGKKVGPNVKVRESFVGSYFAVVGKTRWVVTKAGTWILAARLTPRVSVRAA